MKCVLGHGFGRTVRVLILKEKGLGRQQELKERREWSRERKKEEAKETDRFFRHDSKLSCGFLTFLLGEFLKDFHGRLTCGSCCGGIILRLRIEIL